MIVESLNAKNFNRYPYLDTFKRYSLKKGILYNDNMKTCEGSNFILSHTDGNADKFINDTFSEYSQIWI